MKNLLISAALLAAAFSLQAQDHDGPWSLKECMDYALSNNISIRQQEINVKQRDIDVNTAQNSRLPGVSGSSSENFSFGRGLTQDNTYANTNTNSTSFSLGGEVPVFNGFQIKNTIEQDKLNLQAATADLEKAKDDIRVSVAQYYAQILYDVEILDVARNQVTIDSMQVERLSFMLDNGKASIAEVAQQKSTLAQSRLSVTQAENNLRLAELDLAQLMELPSPEGFSVVRPDQSALEPSILENPESIYAQAVGIKPSILAEDIRLKAADSGIKVAKSSFYPSLSLSGGIGSNYYNTTGAFNTSFMDQMKNNFSQYLGLSLSIPIFSRFNYRNNVRSAELSRESQRLTLDNAKKSLYKEIQQAYYNAVASQSKLRSSEEAEASARESFDLVSAKYENGKANITEFNESKNAYVKAQSDLAQARYENLFQTRILDFYKGEEIVF